MRLKKIKISKFKSIYDELELNFDDIKGFWKIGGPVGAGKTTIGEAIIFGLFGVVGGKNNADLISWGEKHALIEVWCNSKGHDIYIKREINKYGQSPIYVEVDNEELIFTNKRDAQSQLETDYYDVTRTTLELLCVISFNNFKSFATLNANDTKKFLDQVLGFHTLTRYGEICTDCSKEVLNNFNEVSAKISNNQSQIERILDITNKAVIEGDIKQTESDIKSLEQKKTECLTDFDNEIKTIRAELSELQTQLTKIKVLGANKKKEIDIIKKGICPTCGASIDQSQLPVKEQEREVLVESYKNTDAVIKQKQIDIKQKEADKKSTNDMYSKQISDKKVLLVQLKEQKKREKINYDTIDTIKNQIAELDKDKQKYEDEISQWNELYNILTKDVRAKILTSFIPTLNKNILNYTQQLQQQYIIEYDPSFKCNVRICGLEDSIPISSLSTGQLKIVDMCIIMGILGTIMNNTNFNLLLLDELFSNLDSDLRSIMCKMLKSNLKPDMTLFIISHTDIGTNKFDGEISADIEFIDEVHKKSNYNFIFNHGQERTIKTDVV